MEMSPILDMFAMLEIYLPEGYIPQVELDEKSMLKVCFCVQLYQLLHLPMATTPC